MIITTAEESKQLDREAMETWGLPEKVLMENAGASLTSLMNERVVWKDSGTVILCGTGNNGGDGFVIARYAYGYGADVTVLLMGNEEHMSEASLTYKHIIEKMGIPVISIEKAEEALPYFQKADILVDALIGTGIHSKVTGEKAKVIAFVNDANAFVVSVDVPSGMNADTGEAEGISVKADFTVALGSVKRGHVLYPGKEYTGALLYSPIGIPDEARKKYPLRQTEAEDLRMWLPARNPVSHKGNFGFVGIIAGSCGMEGAALLAARGAIRSGAGKVSLLTVEKAAAVLAGKTPEIMVSAAGKEEYFTENDTEYVLERMQSFDTVAIGPGMGRTEEMQKFIASLITRYEGTIVADADALFAIAEKVELKNCPGQLILTPHVGEFSKLTGLTAKDIETHRIDFAVDFARKNQVILVLKGVPTIVALPDGRAWINPTGNPGMAAGGMGDTLTGIIASLAGQGLGAEKAAVAGVYLHGYAGDILRESADDGYTASDLACKLPEAKRRVVTE